MAKKIMFVDDEKDFLFSLKINFEEDNKDFEFIGITSGEDCLEYLKNEELPDLIFLDLLLPKMNGKEIYRRIQNNPEWNEIPIVFISARTDKIAEYAHQFLSNNFIEKPIEYKEIINQIEKLLDK